MKACALMANKELNFVGHLALARFMTAVKYIGSSLTSDEIWFVAHKSQCGTVEEEEGQKVNCVHF
jgi:hypothetical protein